MHRPQLPCSSDILPTHHIEGASVQITVDQTRYKLRVKTNVATFSLYPTDKEQSFNIIVTPRDLPGRFKNSGFSTFGPFFVSRLPGRNSVLRLGDSRPLSGNAVLMWPNVDSIERGKVLDYLEKVIRSALPRLSMEQV